MRLRFVFLAVAGTLVGVACNLLNGVGDLEEVVCTDDCDSGPVSDAQHDTKPVDTGSGDTQADTSPRDAPSDTSDSGLPTFCSGITFYAPFDGALASKAGESPESPPTLPFADAGKFGQAVDLTGGVSFSTLYYPAAFNTTVIYSAARGTFALWIKPTWSQPCSSDHALIKPKVDRMNLAVGGGPQITCGPGTGTLGAVVNEGDGGTVQAGLPLATVSTVWNAADWNHLVATWDQALPQLTFDLNGGGVGAHAENTNKWVPGEPTVNYVRLGSTSTLPQALYDEVVIWDRVLSPTEITAVHALTVALGTACKM
jgi:hypothetical protein